MFSLLQLPDFVDCFAGIFQLSGHRVDMGGIDHGNHSDTAIKRPQKLCVFNATCLSQPVENRRLGPTVQNNMGRAAVGPKHAAGFPETRHR